MAQPAPQQGVRGRQLLLALACVALAAAAMPGAHAAKDPGETPSALPCSCTDVAPRTSFLAANVTFSCWDQWRFDQCPQPFMKEAIEEIPEGYCQISCGGCDCCPTLDQVLQSKGLGMFRWMLSFSEVGANNTQQPGYMATLLAPTDGAILDMLSRMGYPNKEAVEADEGAKALMADLGRYHTLPPVQPMQAVWTAPFMRRSAQLYTAVVPGPHMVTADRDPASNGGKARLSSPKSSAWLVEEDVYACKGFVQVIDTALVPWSTTGYA